MLVCIQLSFLISCNKISAGKSLLFWDLHPDYVVTSVTGLGEKKVVNDDLEIIHNDRERVRVGAAVACKQLKDAEVTNIHVDDFDGYADSAAEGSVLSLWKYDAYKTKKTTIPQLSLYNPTNSKQSVENLWQQGTIKADAQNIARKLSDTPANLMTPTIFSNTIKEILQPFDVDIQDHDAQWAHTERMNAFLAVAKGSVEPPVFLELTYKHTDNAQPFVLIGKGVTFDSGGISLKNSKDMDEMRADMSGAACVVATLYAIAKQKLNVPLKVLVPLVENLPSGCAVKPGDVVIARNGKSICIDNTDAEGRLILADALSYSEKFCPKWVLDIATLTGAMRVALGDAATGVFTNTNSLYKTLEESSAKTGDRIWRMPLWKHYTKQVTEYDAYDVNNVGKGKGGGSCTAAAFLKEFIPEKTPWMHLDMAGVMGPASDLPYLAKGMTGRPTRTLIEFIEAQCNS